MIRRSLVVGVDDLSTYADAVLCRDVTVTRPGGTRMLRRGTVLSESVRASLNRQPGLQVEVVQPEPGEVTQSEASRLIAEAVTGSGLVAEPPHQGQVLVRAAIDGLLRVRGSGVVEANALGAVLLATALDGRRITAGETVAVVKAPSLWVRLDEIYRTRSQVGEASLLRAVPFVARSAAFLAGPRVRKANAAAAAASLGRTLGNFNTSLIGSEQVTDDPPAIAAAYRRLQQAGADVILIGGSIVLDPGDPFLVAVELMEGEIVCRGAPIDPGTMFWVARVGSGIVLGLASCEMYGRLSVLDLILPFALAREAITPKLFAQLGYGGLLEQTYRARNIFAKETGE